MMEEWRDIIQSFYTDLERQTYCVPPVYFRRVLYSVERVAGQTVLVAQSPSADGLSRSKRTPQTGGNVGSSLPEGSPRPKPFELPSKGTPEDTLTSSATECSESGQPVTLDGAQSQSLAEYDVRKASGTGGTQKASERYSAQKAFEKGDALKIFEKDDAQDSVSTHVDKASCATPITTRLWARSLAPLANSVSPEQVDDSSTRDDFAQQHVLHCLQKFGSERGEVMFIVSQLNFSDYLNKKPYAAAAAILPTISDLPKEYRRGDFDILLVHRQRGILLAEVKSVGFKADALGKSQAQRDADVAKRLLTALKQLDKGDKVVRHIMNDIAPTLVVRKTLILPYVTREQLQRVLDSDSTLKQKACASLGAADTASASVLCVCSDQLSPRDRPWHVSPSVLQQMVAWFDRRMDAVDTNITLDIYLDIVARLAGPATTVRVHCVIPPRVEVRTLGQAVSESGERVAQIVLTPTQLDLLNRSPQTAYLTGPPGTGKTLMLVLQGLQWLQQGHDVHVVSMRAPSLPVTRLIHYQLQMTLKTDKNSPPNTGKAFLHHFDLYEDSQLKELLDTLVAASRDGALHMLLDEADLILSKEVLQKAMLNADTEAKRRVFEGMLKSGVDFGGRMQRVINDLKAHIPRLHVWAASMYHIEETEEQPVELLTVPLRCAPAVLRELKQGAHSSFYTGAMHRFTSSSAPSPCDGPQVIHLNHQGPSHSGHWPVECTQCGLDVAKSLRKLHVGDSEEEPKLPQEASSASIHAAATTSPPSLQWRDVLVLTRSSELCDDLTDEKGEVKSPACGFVKGLREAGLPTFVLERNCDKTTWEEGASAVALSLYNKVTVTHFSAAQGLERKVVVHLTGRKKGTEHLSADFVEAEGRVLAVARCLAQLIVVNVPH